MMFAIIFRTALSVALVGFVGIQVVLFSMVKAKLAKQDLCQAQEQALPSARTQQLSPVTSKGCRAYAARADKRKLLMEKLRRFLRDAGDLVFEILTEFCHLCLESANGFVSRYVHEKYRDGQAIVVLYRTLHRPLTKGVNHRQ
jgi:hypothetical protein